MGLKLPYRPALPLACPAFAGRMIGARRLWIDNVANGEAVSTSGKLSKQIAPNCWTQREHLAAPDGPHYRGAVLQSSSRSGWHLASTG
jgi:hypothetical protein